jgi:hypothetical protein
MPDFDRTLLEDFAQFGPFGNPDGRRSDLDDFIEFKYRDFGHGLAMGEDSNRVRVIIGRKGAGKTLYMRRQKSLSEHEKSVIVVKGTPKTHVPIILEGEETTALRSDHVIRVAHLCPPELLTEVWMRLWGRAILYSVVTAAFNEGDFRAYVDKEWIEGIKRDFSGIIRDFGKEPRTPYTTLVSLISRTRTLNGLLKMLDDPLWDDLENRISRLLVVAPPVFIFLDAHDEFFNDAPMYWLRCQKGLFYETLRLHKHTKLGGRLHVVISIRELVFSSVLRSEHAPKYIGDPHLRFLSWDLRSAEYLLQKKIEGLTKEWWKGVEAPTSFQDWVGLSRIVNSWGGEEDSLRYALRHTQLHPRDVVILGNRVAAEVRTAASEGLKSVPEARLRACVSSVALFSAMSQIEVAANHLKSDDMPVSATAQDFTSVYTSVRELTDSWADEILKFIGEIGYLRFRNQDFIRYSQMGGQLFSGSDIFSVLWQNGLLGYREGGEDVFYALDVTARFRIPRDKTEYVFHPGLREAAELKVLRPGAFE